ncbi:MAG: LytR/AlgR family response regulator transcription factor [Chitinophagaceae bacterium]
MIRAVIIDDEKNNIDNLEGLLLTHCPLVKVVAVGLNADQGKEIISIHQPELVFLDIHMPGKSGFDLLRELPERHFEIIFVTAFDQYGIQAVKFSAIDYLLKPLDIEELKTAVNKATLKSNREKKNIQLENLLELVQQRESKSEHRLALATAKETRLINPDQIIRCESTNAYTSFYLTGGEKIMVSKPIFEYEELLKDYGFIRCHQSHLVNKTKVKSWIKENGGQLLMEGGSLIPISRNKKDHLSALLTQFGKNK